jgi:hypothetical protein
MEGGPAFMDLLTNAIESIQVGVEDYQAGTRPRLLSAVRNIHAGILLLYKEALRRLSPKDSNDALMMAKILPTRDTHRKVVFVGVGKKTVDTQQIKERFEALGIQQGFLLHPPQTDLTTTSLRATRRAFSTTWRLGLKQWRTLSSMVHLKPATEE